MLPYRFLFEKKPYKLLDGVPMGAIVTKLATDESDENAGEVVVPKRGCPRTGRIFDKSEGGNIIDGGSDPESSCTTRSSGCIGKLRRWSRFLCHEEAEEK